MITYQLQQNWISEKAFQTLENWKFTFLDLPVWNLFVFNLFNNHIEHSCTVLEAKDFCYYFMLLLLNISVIILNFVWIDMVWQMSRCLPHVLLATSNTLDHLQYLILPYAMLSTTKLLKFTAITAMSG